MRLISTLIVTLFLCSLASVPGVDASGGSSSKASMTKFELRAAIRAKRTASRKAARPASVELPAIAKGGLLFGDKEATTTVVMFTDIECPFCQRFHSVTYPDIKKEFVDTKKVRFVVRHFPLSFHRNAMNAAKAVVCARAQSEDKGRELYERLIAQQSLALDTILDHAELHGLAIDTLVECMAAKGTQQTIDADIAAGKAADVTGTPSFLIVGPTGKQSQITGAYPFDTFLNAIADVQSTK